MNLTNVNFDFSWDNRKSNAVCYVNLKLGTAA